MLFLHGQPTIQSYRTAVGEIRTVTLEDGTSLVVNGATAFRTRFDGHSRDLVLTAGELFVTVGKDGARPFRIHAGDRTIEDVGTIFDVNMHANAVDVAVREGTVLISGLGIDRPTVGERKPDTATLSMGQALTYGFAHALDAPRSVAAQQVGTWRVGVLTYDQVPLEWLVADLNRRFDGAITITDPELAAMTVTLTLKLRDRDGTIGTLENYCRSAPCRGRATPSSLRPPSHSQGGRKSACRISPNMTTLRPAQYPALRSPCRSDPAATHGPGGAGIDDSD